MFGFEKGTNKYYPCKKLKSYPLNMMTTIDEDVKEKIMEDMISIYHRDWARKKNYKDPGYK